MSRSTTTQIRRTQVLTFNHQLLLDPEPSSSSSASPGFSTQSAPVRYVPALSPITQQPKLFSVSNLPPHLIVRPFRTRTGTVNPPLPGDYPMSDASPLPSPLRTTSDGVRLEITPTAMLALSRPEIVTHTVISPPSSQSGGSVPEIDPDI